MVLGASVKLWNKAEFVKEMADVNQKIRQHSAEVRLAAAAAAGQAKSFEAQHTKLTKLNSLLEAQKNAYSRLQERLKELQRQHRINASAHDKLVSSYNAEKETLVSIETKLGTNSSAYLNQKQVVESLAKEVATSSQNHRDNEREIGNVTTKLTNAETAYIKTAGAIEKLNLQMKASASGASQNSLEHGKLRDVISAQESHLADLKGKYVDVAAVHGSGAAAARSLAEQIVNVSGSLKENKDKVEAAKKSADELDKSLGENEKAANETSGAISSFNGVVIGMAMAITTQALAALKNLAKASFEVGMNFEAGMTKVQALSGSTDIELEQLSGKAKQLGATTNHTARDIADAYGYMALAGWKHKQMLEGIDGAAALASASGEDFARTTDILTDVLTALNKEAKDSGEFVDVLASAAANSNTTVSMLGESFKYAAPVAGEFGASIQDLTLMIGLMANAGIKADKAGTAMRSILLRLSSPTEEVAGAMEKLGLRVTNSDGSMRSLFEIVTDLRSSMGKLSQQEKLQVANAIAGKQAVAGLLSVVNASPADFQKLKYAIDNSGGAAKEMADTMMKSGKGAVVKLQSKIEGLQIALYEKLKPAFDVAIVGANGVADVFGGIIQCGLPLIGTIGGIVAAFMAFKTVSTITSTLGITLSGIASVLTGMPATIAIIAAGLATVGLGIAQWHEYLNTASPEIQEHTDAITANKDAWDKAVEARTNAYSTGLSHIANLRTLKTELYSIVDANGKVKQGYEERAKFITGELSKALGIEIKDVGNVIQNYDNIKKKIEEVIEVKRANILLESQEGTYKEALSKRDENYREAREYETKISKLKGKIAEFEKGNRKNFQTYEDAVNAGVISAFTASEHKRLLTDLEAEKKNYDERIKLAKKYTFEISQYEYNREQMAAGHYDKMRNVSSKYIEDYEKIGDAEKNSLIQQIQDEEANLEQLKEFRSKTNDEMFDSQIKFSEKRLEELKSSLVKYKETTAEKLDTVPQIWDENLQKQVETITGKKYTFQENGDGTISAFIDGQASKVGEAEEVASWLADKTALALGSVKEKSGIIGKDSMSEFEKGIMSLATEVGNAGLSIGGHLIQGLIDGFGAHVSILYKNVVNACQNVIDIFTGKKGFDEHSPSKVTARIGRFVAQGLQVGMETEMPSVLNSAQNFARNTVYSLQSGVRRPSIAELRFSSGYKPTDFAGSIDSTSIRRRTHINSSESTLLGDSSNLNMLTEAFTRALSNVKIQLSEERVGEFVERRMDKIIYR